MVSAEASASGAVTEAIPPCVGDCDGDGAVRVAELILMVNILLGSAPASACPAAPCDDGVFIHVDCELQAVNHALNGCPAPSPTPAASITYHLDRGSLSRFAPHGVPVTQLLSGTFQAAIAQREDGERIRLTEIDFSGGAIEPSMVTGSGVIDAPAAGPLTMTATLSFDGEPIELRGEAPISALWGSPPTIDQVTVCGAPDGAVTCEALRAGNASGYALSIRAVPEGTQTPGPTVTPTPVVLTRYRLVEGSSIALRERGSDPTPVPQPLAGTFTVAPCAFVPNTFFAYVIIDVDLDGGPQYVVSGGELRVGCPGGVGLGYTDALTLAFPPEVYMGLRLVINGRAVGVGGYGPFDQRQWMFGRPPTLESLRLCGSPNRSITCGGLDAGEGSAYELLISAVPDG
jgi:hypothetical protein